MRYPPTTQYTKEQRKLQAEWKHTAPGLPCEARQVGSWKKAPRDFIIPIHFAEYNIWEPIRGEVLQHFEAERIEWHSGRTDHFGPRERPGPSPHLLDSQICAINFWWGLSQSPAGLTTALRSLLGSVAAVAAPEPDGPLVEPEWIGKRNYMGELGQRGRGRYATSADVLIAYHDPKGRRHGVLVESKYTETYEPNVPLRWSERGTDRAEIYRAEVNRPDGPIKTGAGVEFEDLMFDPFDQHLRQQLLAAAMEREHELGFETVTCLHVAPEANGDFHGRITAPKLVGWG